MQSSEPFPNPIPEMVSKFARDYKNQHFMVRVKRVNKLILAGLKEEAMEELAAMKTGMANNSKQLVVIASCLCLLKDFHAALHVLKDVEGQILMLETLDKKYNLMRLNLMGLCFHHLNEPKKAVEKWRIGLQIDNKNILFLNNLGTYHLNKGNMTEAARYFWKSKKCKHR